MQPMPAAVIGLAENLVLHVTRSDRRPGTLVAVESGAVTI